MRTAVLLEVAHDVGPRDVAAGAASDPPAREAGQRPDRVQVQARVVVTPASRDTLAIQHPSANSTPRERAATARPAGPAPITTTSTRSAVGTGKRYHPAATIQRAVPGTGA